ncbi:MAG: GAF domain-containing protein [Algisphaera sp.]
MTPTPSHNPKHPNPASTPLERVAPSACRVLLVESDLAHRSTLAACARPGRSIEMVFADTVAQAREVLSEIDFDAALVCEQLPDGSGIDLAREIASLSRPTAAIVMGTRPDFALACAALRAGADDFVLDTVGVAELAQRLDAALDRKSREKSHIARVARLHRLCKKLNRARIDISNQVDHLCNDLVTAYQELACQMQNATQSGEFSTLIEDELDLEVLLRKTLEHLIDKVGPSNAAIFLPATMDEYSLGGYVNYDCPKESVDQLLDDLADTLAPRVAESGEDIIHLTNDADIDRWTGNNLGPSALRNTSALVVPCMSDGECLAVVTLFRDRDVPFNEAHLDRLSSLGPLLGDALERIIRIHHRTGFTEGFEGFEETQYDGESEYQSDQDDRYDGPDAPESHTDDESPF